MPTNNPSWLVIGEPGVQSVRSVAGKQGDIVLSIDDVQTLATSLSNKISLSAVGAANGVAGLDSNGDLVGRIILTPRTSTSLASIVLLSGEMAFNSDTGQVLRGDGVTLGGIPVRQPTVVTQDLSASGTGSYLLDHQNADVLVVKGYTTDVIRTWTFNLIDGATANAGIKAGTYVGQRLTIKLDLRATTTDGITGGTIVALFSGVRFGWNTSVLGYHGSGYRRYTTEPDLNLDPGTFVCQQAFDLVWDGTYWQPDQPWPSIGNVVDTFGFASGAWARSGTYSLAHGRKLNLNTNPQFGATFGDTNAAYANYCLVGGESSSTGTNASHSIFWGRNLTGPTTISGNVGFQFVMGEGARPRTPLSRTFGHAQGTTDWGSCQAADYLYSAVTTDATATVMGIRPAAAGGHLVVAPKTLYNCIYQLAAYNVTDNAVATVTGRFTIWRDGSNNTALLESVEFSRANSAAMAGFEFTIAADDTNERPSFTVTGFAGKTVRWTLRLTAAEAAGAAAL
jgi:hypothetical protein